ncbi:hypothetical protein Bca4012_011738 [Brassica carinata]
MVCLDSQNPRYLSLNPVMVKKGGELMGSDLVLLDGKCGEALETITASCLPKSHYRPPVYRYSTVLDCTALNSLNLCLQSSFMVLIFGSRLKSERLRDHGKEETNAISFELLQTRHQGETFVEPLLICKRLHNALVSAF